MATTTAPVFKDSRQAQRQRWGMELRRRLDVHGNLQRQRPVQEHQYPALPRLAAGSATLAPDTSGALLCPETASPAPLGRIAAKLDILQHGSFACLMAPCTSFTAPTSND